VSRLAAMLALVLVVTVIMGLALGRGAAGFQGSLAPQRPDPMAGPGAKQQVRGPSERIRVMTYNIKSYLADEQIGSFRLIAREVALHDPDILVMQDAGRLSELWRGDPKVAGSIFTGREVYTGGEYIVVSRHPLHDCRLGDISFGAQGHAYVRCTVVANGVEFDLFTAHFLSPRDGLNAARYERAQGVGDWQRNFNDRLAQAHKLASDASSRRRPLVVAGDLNAPETSPVIRALLRSGLRDAFATAGLGYGYTYGHALRPGFSFLRIDHILVSPEIGVLDCFAGGARASEHRPVIADLLLRRNPA
ncbi:MAG: endonuclease/exonuclease/phosphatase family protein, partial [Burkholderiaceae bacterium]